MSRSARNAGLVGVAASGGALGSPGAGAGASAAGASGADGSDCTSSRTSPSAVKSRRSTTLMVFGFSDIGPLGSSYFTGREREVSADAEKTSNRHGRGRRRGSRPPDGKAPERVPLGP